MITTRNIRFFPLPDRAVTIAYLDGPDLDTDTALERIRERYPEAEATLLREGPENDRRYDLMITADRSVGAMLRTLLTKAGHRYYLDPSLDIYVVGLLNADFWARALKAVSAPVVGFVSRLFGRFALASINLIIRLSRFR